MKERLQAFSARLQKCWRAVILAAALHLRGHSNWQHTIAEIDYCEIMRYGAHINCIKECLVFSPGR